MCKPIRIMDYVVFGLFILASLIGLASLVFGLPGTFIILAASLLYGWYGGFEEITLKIIVILVILVLIGELIEFLLGIAGSKKYKSSNKAIVGSIIGAIAGGIMGAPFFFGIGAVIGAFVGAFAGAIAVELLLGKSLNESVQSGWGAFLGRVAGTISKGAIAVAMVVITVAAVTG